jgi:hypothetical protein
LVCYDVIHISTNITKERSLLSSRKRAVLTRNLLDVSEEWCASIFRIFQEVTFFYDYSEDWDNKSLQRSVTNYLSTRCHRPEGSNINIAKASKRTKLQSNTQYRAAVGQTKTWQKCHYFSHAFAKLWKVSIRFVMSACLFAWNISAPKGQFK